MIDPLTREVISNKEDLDKILDLVLGHDAIVLHNAKFDVLALSLTDSRFKEWPWGKTYDTIIAGHLLGSNQPHNLTDMVMQYLGIDIKPWEAVLKEACQSARKLCKKELKHLGWRIAEEGLPDMPSVKKSGGGGRDNEKDKAWKNDMWLPRALAVELGVQEDHPWHTVLRDYALKDAEVTLKLWIAVREELLIR